MSLGMVRCLFNAETLNSSDTITSDPFRMDEGIDFGLWCKADLKNASYSAILQCSYNDDPNNFAATSAYPSIATGLSSSTINIFNITDQNMMYGRIRFSGISGNNTSTKITAYIFNREDCF